MILVTLQDTLFWGFIVLQTNITNTVFAPNLEVEWNCWRLMHGQ